MVNRSRVIMQAIAQDRPGKQFRGIRLLFALLSVYLVLPLIDLPVFGFSLSAVLFAVIFLFSVRVVKVDLKRYRLWVLLAVLIACGVLASFFANGLRSGGTDIEGASIAVHYVYWLFFFVIVFYLLAENVVSIKRTVEVIGLAVFFLALLRLFEAAVLGKIGAWTGTQFFPQNTYGFLFSMFAPANFYLVLEKKGGQKLLAIGRVVAILAAVLINGSRGSWIALGVSLAGFVILAAVSARSARPVLTAVMLIAVLAVGYWSFVSFMPREVVTAFENRFNTLNDLDADKSYGIRQLMVQKGLILFAESPILGVGPSRFAVETRMLDLPTYMAYGSQEHFNRITAHNSYIGFLAEEGLIASLPYLILVSLIGVLGGISCLRLVRRKQVWALGVYACFLSMSVHMWGINSLTNTANWFIYALNVAMILIAISLKSKQNESPARPSLSRPGHS